MRPQKQKCAFDGIARMPGAETHRQARALVPRAPLRLAPLGALTARPRPGFGFVSACADGEQRTLLIPVRAIARWPGAGLLGRH